jgi:predicted transcriptional regulator
MSTLTIRLPEALDHQLAALAEAESKTRSEVARTALEKFFRDREREQLMAELVAAARQLAENPEARAEALEIAEEAIPFDNEALDIAEGRKLGESWPEELGERWWK